MRGEAPAEEKAGALPLLRSTRDFFIAASARLSWAQIAQVRFEISQNAASAFEVCSPATFRPSRQTCPILSSHHTAPEFAPERCGNFQRGLAKGSSPSPLRNTSISD